MNDYYTYLFDVINDSYKMSKILIDKIRSIGKCPTCGGTYVDSECIYCGKENDDLKAYIDRLKLILRRFNEKIVNLPIKNMPINNFFNYLCTISDVKLSCIDEFLGKYDYKRRFALYADELFRKMNSNEDYDFSILDINVIESIVYSNNESFNQVYLQKYFISRALKHKSNISYECFKQLIVNFVIVLMGPYYKSPKCSIVETKIDEKTRSLTLGSSIIDRIDIGEIGIRNLYEKGDYFLLDTIFHELLHTIQYRHIFYGDTIGIDESIDPLIILELKDHILTKGLEGYYKDNYASISYEIEAEYHATHLTEQFLQSIGLTSNKKDGFMEIDDISKLSFSTERLYMGEKYSIDELFDKYLYDHPELLTQHKQLARLYKLEDGHVVKKSIEEFTDNRQI